MRCSSTILHKNYVHVFVLWLFYYGKSSLTLLAIMTDAIEVRKWRMDVIKVNKLLRKTKWRLSDDLGVIIIIISLSVNERVDLIFFMLSFFLSSLFYHSKDWSTYFIFCNAIIAHFCEKICKIWYLLREMNEVLFLNT